MSMAGIAVNPLDQKTVASNHLHNYETKKAAIFADATLEYWEKATLYTS